MQFLLTLYYAYLLIFLESGGGSFVAAILILILMVVLLRRGRKRFGRAVVALALGALVSLLIGTLAYDVVSHLQTLDDNTLTDFIYYLPPWGFPTINVAFLILGVGVNLNVVAAVLGLSKATWLGHWGWFVAMVIALVVAFVIGTASYRDQLDYLALFNPQLSDGIRNCSPYNALLQVPCDMGRTTMVYLLMSVLTVITPLVPLLYGLKGADELQATKPTPMPA
jgi:hypothetical protein